MSKFQQFFKQNKTKKSYVKYAVTKSLLDENGKPLEWTIKSLTTNEDQKIRKTCYYTEKNAKNETEEKFDVTKYINKMLCACIVEPKLHDKELQDSYGVMTPENLLLEMVDNPDEYDNLTKFVKGLNNDNSLFNKIEEVKN